MPEIVKVVINLKHREEVVDLIDDLKRCLKSSEASGGMYHAVIKDETAEVDFRVWVPAKCLRAKETK